MINDIQYSRNIIFLSMKQKLKSLYYEFWQPKINPSVPFQSQPMEEAHAQLRNCVRNHLLN